MMGEIELGCEPFNFNRITQAVIRHVLLPFLTVKEVAFMCNVSKSTNQVFNDPEIYHILIRVDFPLRKYSNYFRDWKKRYAYASKKVATKRHNSFLCRLRAQIRDAEYMSRILRQPMTHSEWMHVQSSYTRIATLQETIQRVKDEHRKTWCWLYSSKRTHAFQRTMRQRKRQCVRALDTQLHVQMASLPLPMPMDCIDSHSQQQLGSNQALLDQLVIPSYV